MLTDKLAILGPSSVSTSTAGRRAADAVSGESFRDVFQSLTRSMEKSRAVGREAPAAPAEKPDGAPQAAAQAPAREPSRRPEAAEDAGRPAPSSAEAPEAAEAPEPTSLPDAPDEGDAAEKAAERGATLLPLDPVQQEIIERVAVLAADNGLDAQMLAALPEEDLAELADWALAGAGGLFPEAPAASEALPLGDVAALPRLGLEAETLAFSQFDSLLQRVAAAPVRDTALIGELVNLGEMPSLDVDRLAQAVLAAAGGAGNADAAASDLRTLLAGTPGEDLRAALEAALAKTGDGTAELPEMPEVVLKSLAVEIVNVNNAELDAAGKRLALLNGLDNNAQLRSDLLAQVRAADSAELDAAVSGEKLSASLEDSPFAADLLETGTGIELSNDEAAATAPKTANPAAATPETETPGILESLGDPEATGEKTSPAAKAAPAIGQATETSEDEDAAPAAPQAAPEDALLEEEEAPEESRERPQPTRKAPEKDAAATATAFEPEKEETAGDAEREGPEPLATVTVRHDGPQAADHAGEAKENPLARQAALQENVNRLADLVDQAVKSDNRTLKSLTMALTPPELGQVRVELEMTKNGGVSATVKVENDSARTLLLSGLDQLRKSLEHQGVSLEQFNVEMDGKDAGAEERQRQQQQAAGGEWSGAQSEERGRRARAAANRAEAAGVRRAAPETEETPAIPAMRHIDGNSFELIA